MNTDIQFSLTRDEAQMVLNAVSQMPYHMVVTLVNKLQQQAQACIADQESKNAQL